jgi:alpha-amylase
VGALAATALVVVAARASVGALAATALVVVSACGDGAPATDAVARAPLAAADLAIADYWNGATVYFLLTDRFRNGDPGNDGALGRGQDAAPLRGFLGGDLSGVLEKMREGYFDSLGVTALWMTPFVEQIHGGVDEGTGTSYGFHGYWTRDWTAVDPALGAAEDLRAVVDEAHRRGIRVIMDAVINHTGPVTPLDPQWPDEWVRTTPRCTYRDYATTVDCTLVDNLPDVLTGSDEPVALPDPLREKWAAEGRLDLELAELDSFFRRTGYPRAPRYYLIKWLTDWVREMGIDGYRVDTAKHFEEEASAALAREAHQAFSDWKAAHPGEALDDLPFFMMGEVYGYGLGAGRDYDFGDRKVDFFSYGYDALINFAFKSDARLPLDELFTTYDAALRDGPLAGVSVVNYVSSHDDGGPYDLHRQDPYGAGTRLLLAPGMALVYYGDEVARPLGIDGANGDANLRSPMDWRVVDEQRADDASVLEHWRKLGRFRPATGTSAPASTGSSCCGCCAGGASRSRSRCRAARRCGGRLQIGEGDSAEAIDFPGAEVAEAAYSPEGWEHKPLRMVVRRVAFAAEGLASDPRARRRRSIPATGE